MILGRYKHTIDAKNRIFIPAGFRSEFGDRCILSRDISDNCINIYPMEQWKLFNEKIAALPAMKMKNIKQFVYSNSFETEIDSQGRIILNRQHLKDANLKKDIMITGNSTHAQIWSLEEWEKYEAILNGEASQEEMIRQLTEIGF